MKRSITTVLLLALLTGCATFSSLIGRGADRADLWARAQSAFAKEDFDRADDYFQELATLHADSPEGRESLFFLGALRLDPRNENWNSVEAESWLGRYLDLREGEDSPRLYRYPEAHTLFEIAHQLNLPPDSRIAGLQPGERVITIEERVLVPAEQSRELMQEIERLRREIASRDETIRSQEEELERIRRTLTGPGRSSDGG